MLKMASYEPFGHLQHKLWMKEGPRVKLAIWLPTIRSRELTRPRCVQVECDMPLESSWGKLQVYFRPHLDQRFEQRIMNSQSLGSPNQDSFSTPPWEFREKMPFRCRWHGVCREYYMGEGDDFPRAWTMVSHVSPESPVACPSIENAPKCELTNLLVGLMQVRVAK
jgi:hypothetical protein